MRFLFILIAVFFMLPATAQQPDSIAYKKVLFSYQYQKPAGTKLRNRELKTLLRSRPESRKYFLKYKRGQLAANFSALVGLGLFLLSPRDDPFGKYRGKIDPLKATAAVVIAGSLYLSFHSLAWWHRAVKAYNTGL